MKIRSPDEKYIKQAENLTTIEKDRLLSRMHGKLMHRLEDKKLSTLEAIAIQLEIDDRLLAEWREKMSEIKEKEKSKKKH